MGNSIWSVPLQAERMSIPMTCPLKRQDIIFYTLYSGNEQYLKDLIEESVINIAREYPTEGVRDALQMLRPTEIDSLHKLRMKFFILLNEDEAMRHKLSMVKSSTIAPLCEHKARRFYDELSDKILANWVRNGNMDLEGVVDIVRDSYLHS